MKRKKAYYSDCNTIKELFENSAIKCSFLFAFYFLTFVKIFIKKKKLYIFAYAHDLCPILCLKNPLCCITFTV